MSENTGALTEAQQKAKALLDAAKNGAIIPIRLPGQIEEIVQLLTQAEEQHKTAAAAPVAAAVPADMEAYNKDEAYFVGHAVHELNTPLTSIRGYSDMLGSMGELNDMQKQFLDVVKTNAQRMQSLLSDFRYLNKLRKGVLEPTAKMDAFKNISMKIEKDLKKRAEELKRTLEIDVPQGLPLLNLDGDLLGLALVKLVENGLQYSAAETGKVTVTAHGEESWLVIVISDNGIGMTEEELSHLGEVYFRGERDEVREYKGSGLGIPIAYGVIKLLGGTVTVTSKLDEGTTFTVKIPGMI